MSGRDLILTGVPRAGTTLCCDLLGRADDTVALVEPMPVQQLPLQHAAAVDAVRAFFAASRCSVLQRGAAIGQQVDGKSVDNFFDGERGAHGRRVRKVQLGEVRIDKPLAADFTLVIKHNAAFAALLPTLVQSFACLAVVRNPLAVLASWNSVDLPVAQGRLPAGERLEPALAEALDARPALLERQLLLLDWLFTRFSQCLPRRCILRYEDVVESAGAALAEASGVPVPTLALASRNANRLYRGEDCIRFMASLREHAGAWRQFYTEQDLQRLLDAMVAQA